MMISCFSGVSSSNSSIYSFVRPSLVSAVGVTLLSMLTSYPKCLTMAKTNQTPVSYWLSLPLPSLCKWIKVSNQLVKEARERRKNK